MAAVLATLPSGIGLAGPFFKIERVEPLGDEVTGNNGSAVLCPVKILQFPDDQRLDDGQRRKSLGRSAEHGRFVGGRIHDQFDGAHFRVAVRQFLLAGIGQAAFDNHLNDENGVLIVHGAHAIGIERGAGVGGHGGNFFSGVTSVAISLVTVAGIFIS